MDCNFNLGNQNYNSRHETQQDKQRIAHNYYKEPSGNKLSDPWLPSLDICIQGSIQM